MKPIRPTQHAVDQCKERGTNEFEVHQAIQQGWQEPAKKAEGFAALIFP